MKKFPFSKKAINIMIATALLVTPLSTLAPVGGTVTIVEAALPEGTLDNLLELKSYYDGLTVNQETIIDEHRALLGDLSTEWGTILDSSLESDINKNLNSHTATEMMTDLANVFLQTNYTDVSNQVIAFHDKYSTEFNAAFGISFIDFLGFYADLIDNVKASYNQSTIEAAIGNSLTDFMVSEAKKVSSYSTLSTAVKGVIGSEYDVASLIQIKFNTMSALDGKSNYAPGTLKNTLIAAVKQNLNTVSTGGNTGGSSGSTGETTTPTPDPTSPGTVDASESTTTTTETAADGTQTAVTTVDATKLTQSLQNTIYTDKVSFKVENSAGVAAQVRIPSQAFAAVTAKNPNAKVEIQSYEGTIRVPSKEINVNNIAQSLGVNADDVQINISIKTVSVPVNAQGSAQSISPVVEFKITATSGDKSQEISRFNSHVERDINSQDDLNPNTTTVVRLNEDGSIDKAVPTLVNGKTATFKNMSNSLYTIIENEETFPDITTNWAKATIEKMASKMIIEGMPSGNFEPTKTTTRAEFAALLTRSLGLNDDLAYDDRFSDVNGQEWFVADIMAAVDAGIITGHADGSFKGNDPVTREQAAAMIARAITMLEAEVDLDETKGLNNFTDESEVSTWAAVSLEQLIQAEIISGRPGAKIAPKSGSQRAEVTVMLERFLKSVNFMN